MAFLAHLRELAMHDSFVQLIKGWCQIDYFADTSTFFAVAGV